MALVAGIVCTQRACTVLVRDVGSGRVMRSGAARHDTSPQVHPGVWWDSMRQALEQAGGLADVSAVSVVGTAHSVVFLDADGAVIGPSPVGVPAHRAATHLITEFGTGDLIERVGGVPTSATPAALVRWWCHEHPDAAARLAALALPHEWLAWRLRGGGAGQDPTALVTDRSAASLTGMFNLVTGRYDQDIVRVVAGREVLLPRPLLPGELGGRATDGLIVAPGAGHTAAAALGLALRPGDAVVDLGAVGTVAAVWTGTPVAGRVQFASDADAHLLALAPAPSAARELAAGAQLLGVDGSGLAQLALQSPPGSNGVVSIDGTLRGALDAARSDVARAVIEGVLAGQAEALALLGNAGINVTRVVLTGVAARNAAVIQVAPTVINAAIEVPVTSDHALDGAAAQAAWVLQGARPAWIPAMAARMAPDVQPDIARARRHLRLRLS